MIPPKLLKLFKTSFSLKGKIGKPLFLAKNAKKTRFPSPSAHPFPTQKQKESLRSLKTRGKAFPLEPLSAG